MIQKSIGGKELLVVEIYYYRVRVAVVKKQAKSVEIVYQAEHFGFYAAESVLECLGDLRQQKIKLPRKVVLVTTEAIATLQRSKLNETQLGTDLGQTINWEVDSSLQEYSHHPSIEEMLRAPDFMTKAQWQQLQEYEEAGNANSSLPLSIRLQKSAVFSGEDLHDVEEFLDNWPSLLDLGICHTTLDYVDNVKDDTQLSAFLNSSQRDMWINIFEQEGLTLCATMPWTLSSLSFVQEEQIAKDNFIYIEEHPGFLLTVKIRRGRFIALNTFHFDGEHFPDELIEEMESFEWNSLLLNSSNFTYESIASEFKEGRRREIKVTEELKELPILAVSQRVWAMPLFFRSIVIKTMKPAGPLRQRPSTWWVAVSVAMLLFYGAIAFKSYKQYKEEEKRVAQLETGNEKIEQQNKKKTLAVKEEIALSKQLAELQKEVEILQKASHKLLFLNSERPFTYQILQTLADLKSSGVRLRSVKCRIDGEMLIRGDALHDTAAYELVAELSEGLKEYMNAQPQLRLEAKENTSIYTFEISAPGWGIDALRAR